MVERLIVEDVGPERPQNIADSFANRVREEADGWASEDELVEKLKTRTPRTPEPILRNYAHFGTHRRADGRLVWKFDPNGRDQLRMSLTRSYRSPDLPDLIARPTINPMFLNRGANDELHPDRGGNPNLKPELASGLDLALERYLPGSGLLSANVFYRHISNLMRSQTTLETVSWADQPRWVAHKQNIGDAITQGLELEAKFRVSELFAGAPRADVRANASLFASRVQGVPAPDNRLDQQPSATANLGADYRLPNAPFTIGGNINWTPGYTTRLSEDQTIVQGKKLVFDAYALWTINPGSQLRVSFGNLVARDYVSTNSLDSVNPAGQALRESTQTIAPSWLSLQIRLEMKL